VSVPKTQRAVAQYDSNADLLDAYNPVVFNDPNATIPVLVVPEAAVRRCGHGEQIATSFMCVCPECGSWQTWNGFKWTRWQRPRILRVGRVGK
jgi:hypothetical protein